ncbi:MAG: Uma2 family endonuclease [Bryobacteraceae bacterium]
MAIAPVLPQVSGEEYERTPELFERHEYVDGVLIEKPGSTWKHSELQIWLGALLLKYYSWLFIGSELHSKLRESNWRIPDIAVQKR